MSTRGITQARIAKEIGFDRTTVSAILNNRSGMSFRPETRRIVLDAAHRLGYRPHRYAQVMRKGKTGTIAVLQTGGSLYVNEKRSQCIAREINQRGYRISSHHVLWHAQGAKEAIGSVLDSRAEGLILVGPSEMLLTEFVNQTRHSEMAMVCVSGVRSPEVPQVRSDFHQCTFELTNHLIKLGHRRLVFLTYWGSEKRDMDTSWTTLERIQGFQDAIAKSGLRAVQGEVISKEYTPADVETPTMQLGKQSMHALLAGRNRPDAVLCTNDAWAFGAYAACAEAGVRVPQDIAITGIDNEPIGQFMCPPLTTSEQPTEAIAARAVDILLKQIQGEKLSETQNLVKLPCQLVVRQSCVATKMTEASSRSFYSGKAEQRNK